MKKTYAEDGPMTEFNGDLIEDHTMDLTGSQEEETNGEPQRLTKVEAEDKGQGERPREIVPGTQSEGGSHNSDAGLTSLEDVGEDGENVSGNHCD